jgi:hypothetical protein
MSHISHRVEKGVSSVQIHNFQLVYKSSLAEEVEQELFRVVE